MKDNAEAVLAQKPQPDRGMCGSFTTNFLQDPATIADDLRMAGRMIRARRWPLISNKRKRHLISRLFQIADKKIVPISVKDGTFDAESEADKNAINAIKLLAVLEAQVQKDEHHDDEMSKPAAGTTINVDNRKQVILRIPDNGRGPALEHRD